MRVLLALLFSFTLLLAQAGNSFSDEFSDEFESSVQDEQWDPLSGYNRYMTSFNDFVYINVMSPVAKGYIYVTPQPLRTGVSNFFDNLKYPIRFVNNLLQFKFKNAFEETNRFIINSTFGLAGFIDLASSEANLEQHDEDFGQTLAFYGVSNDIHIVWPLLGPSNARDSVGLFVDSFFNIVNYTNASQDYSIIDEDKEFYGAKGVEILNDYALHVKEYETLRKDSMDLYPMLKNIYEQRRQKMIEE